MPLAMADSAEKSAYLVLGGMTVGLIGHLVRILVWRGRNRGAQDGRNLERERIRAEQETQLRDDLIGLVGELRGKETEHRKLIDVLRERLVKADDDLHKERAIKHDILSEVNHMSLVVQLYRGTLGVNTRHPEDNLDLEKLARICKTGDAT